MLGIILLSMINLNAHSTVASITNSACIIPNDKIPFPWGDMVNRHYGLAQNETYYLKGRFAANTDGQLRFIIDLAAQPWLATADRVANPTLQLTATPSVLKHAASLNGDAVKVLIKMTGGCSDPAGENATLNSAELLLPPDLDQCD